MFFKNDIKNVYGMGDKFHIGFNSKFRNSNKFNNFLCFPISLI